MGWAKNKIKKNRDTAVCVPFFLPVDIQHHQCSCRFFNPINRTDTSFVVTKLRHRDTRTVCVFFKLNCFFYPSTSNTIIDSVSVLILRSYKRYKTCGHKATPQRLYYCCTLPNTGKHSSGQCMPCHYTEYDKHDVIHSLRNKETKRNEEKTKTKKTSLKK